MWKVPVAMEAATARSTSRICLGVMAVHWGCSRRQSRRRALRRPIYDDEDDDKVVVFVRRGLGGADWVCIVVTTACFAVSFFFGGWGQGDGRRRVGELALLYHSRFELAGWLL